MLNTIFNTTHKLQQIEILKNFKDSKLRILTVLEELYSNILNLSSNLYMIC